MKRPGDLQSAVERARSTSDIYDLLYNWQGRSAGAMQILASHARVWDEGMVFSVLNSGVGAAEMLDNSHLPDWSFRRIARWHINRLYTESANDSLYRAKMVLGKMARAGRLPLVGEEAREIEALVLPKGKVPNNLARRQVVAVEVLLEHPDATEDLAARLGEAIALLGSREDKLAFVKSRLCPLSLARRIICGHGLPENVQQDLPNWTLKNIGPFEIETILTVDRYRTDPIIREQFVTWAYVHKQAKLFKPLVMDGLEDCADLFRELVRRNTGVAGEVLAAAGPRVAAHLSREDIEPLLASVDPETRLAAIGAVGHTGRSG